MGSSPLTRGKSYSHDIRDFGGKDHPRLRGEKVFDDCPHLFLRGSPPLTRGKANCRVVEAVPQRITPAYAGKSCTSQRLPNRGRDHPRLRGEKRSAGKVLLVRGGSPPLTQGKDSKLDSGEVETGITPAYAGKSAISAPKALLLEDHPRLRGEKHGFSYCIRYGDGSPPLTRGKEKATVDAGNMHRITPAYAGKRSPCNCNRKTAYNHPRLRGEKFYTRPCRASKRGSPPLTRGKESIGTAPFPSMRITPAYAGKSV